MKRTVLGLFFVLAITSGYVLSEAVKLTDSENAVENSEEVHISKRAFAAATLRAALRGLRSKPAQTVLRKLAEYYGKKSSISRVADVIEEVLSVMGKYDTAFSSYFVDAAVRLGLGRDFGLAVYNLIWFLV
ncbi:uncharacterized protein LOC106155516 [Lingula anatina]|uniref:Uncharacterized protein LOC106155516 n=1 Tax=Lingula anatina TaxID=7574 RepID=A0A1S3HIB0_LINAN|nr:uncharacterized protein LOC106155516 [Lingula anatina]|eukprot:XP_013385853.1 uncharacterized protein LOC106155516 [Lingula anatina]